VLRFWFTPGVLRGRAVLCGRVLDIVDSWQNELACFTYISCPTETQYCLIGCPISRPFVRPCWTKHALKRPIRVFLSSRQSCVTSSVHFAFESENSSNSVHSCVLRKSSVRVCTRNRYERTRLRKSALEDPWLKPVFPTGTEMLATKMSAANDALAKTALVCTCEEPNASHQPRTGGGQKFTIGLGALKRHQAG